MLSVVADIGGTNIRLAVLDLATGEMSHLEEYLCEKFPSVEAAFIAYFANLPKPVNYLCIGIACPVEDDLVAMTNNNWAFSKQALTEKLALKGLYVINDYTAISLAVPYMNAQDQVKIGSGEVIEEGVKAIFGPGTGLGVSHLLKQGKKWISLDGEGGHASFAPNTPQQIAVLSSLQVQFGHVSAERLLSGQGIENIYNALCQLHDQPAELKTAADISSAALAKRSVLAEQTLSLFCEIMGGFAGNLALNLQCGGGVYIAGGIVPRFVEFFENSAFRDCFEGKGRMKQYLQTVSTFVITHKNPGLLGASVYLRQELA